MERADYIMSQFGEELLGRSCMIQFEVGKAHKLAFYPGMIQTYRVDFVKEGHTDRQHLVVFEDGDELWFDLQNEAKNKRFILLDKEQWTAQVAEKGDNIRTTRAEQRNNRNKRAAEHRVTEITSTKTPAAVTPERNKKPKRTNEPSWVEDMSQWLRTVPHGKRKNIVSTSNADQVMRQVRKLASGAGICYNAWPSDVVFYNDQPIDLERTDFRLMAERANDHERIYGRDKGNGWLLRHPIRKLQLYQDYALSKKD